MISSCYKHAADMNSTHYKGSLQSSGAPQVCKGKHARQTTKISPRGLWIDLPCEWHKRNWDQRCIVEAVSRIPYPVALIETVK